MGSPSGAAAPPPCPVADAQPTRINAADALLCSQLDAKQFVTMRVRAVYDHEDLDGDVTAEVYQPTPQGAELLQKGSLLPAATPGHAALR